MTAGAPTPDVVLVPVLDGHIWRVEAWLKADHVLRWWNDKDAAKSLLREPARRERQRLICADGEPVGFVQWEPVDLPEWKAWGLDVPDGSLHLDVMIGVEATCGRGVGSAALALLVEELKAHPLIATTSLSNFPCRRAFQKCGFVETEHFYKPGAGRMVLLMHAA